MSPEKGGDLRTESTGGRRALLALFFGAALLLVPFLLLGVGPAHASADAGDNKGTSTALVAVSRPPERRPALQLVRFSATPTGSTTTQPGKSTTARPAAPPAVPTTTATTGPASTTGARPAPTATTGPASTTTTRPAPVASPAPAPAPTTTTSPPPTTTTGAGVLAASGGGNSKTGDATWYEYGGQPYNECASPFLPFGTVVTVRDNDTGMSTQCVVADREADTDRAVDLAPTAFEQLAPLSQGVIAVTISW